MAGRGPHTLNMSDNFQQSPCQDFSMSGCQNRDTGFQAVQVMEFWTYSGRVPGLEAPIYPRDGIVRPFSGYLSSTYSNPQWYAVLSASADNKVWQVVIYTAINYSPVDNKWDVDAGVRKTINGILTKPGAGAVPNGEEVWIYSSGYGPSGPGQYSLMRGVLAAHSIVDSTHYAPAISTEIIDLGYIWNCLYVYTTVPPKQPWMYDNIPWDHYYGDIHFYYDFFNPANFNCTTGKVLIFWPGKSAADLPSANFTAADQGLIINPA